MPQIDDVLDCEWEHGNAYDRFAIKATDAQDTIVGHLPLEISRVVKHLIDRGAVVCARVTNDRYRVSPLIQGGLEIPCAVTVTTNSSFDDRILNRFKDLFKELYQEPEEPVYRESVSANTASKAMRQPSSSTSVAAKSNVPKSTKRKQEKSQTGILKFCTQKERIPKPPNRGGVPRGMVVLSSDDESD